LAISGQDIPMKPRTLPNGLKSLAAYGLPDALRLSKEERAAAWQANPPRSVDPFRPKIDINDQEAYDRRLREIDLARAKDMAKAQAFKSLSAKAGVKRVEKRALKDKAKSSQTQIYITIVKGAGRAPGTKAAARFEAMRAYLKANKDATLADVIANTIYGKADYNWDLAHGKIKSDIRK
jgi:hypothetical protein